MLGPLFCVVVPLALLTADEAAVCSPDPCAEVMAFVGVDLADNVEVPYDGVVVIQANWFGELDPVALFEGLTVGVRRGDMAVDGVLEPTDISGLLLWRPAAPLAPATTYTLSAAFTNPSGVPRECTAEAIDASFEFTTTAAPAEPMTAPQIHVSAQLDMTPQFSLDAIACCGGAMPRERTLCGAPDGLTWSEGQCASMQSRVSLRATISVLVEVEDPTAAQWMRTLYQDGVAVRTGAAPTFTRNLAAPTCFVVKQRNLATEESLASNEVCVDLPSGIAPTASVDPRAMLDPDCARAMYTCEVVDGAWDHEACTPWTFTGHTLDRPNVGCDLHGDAGSPHALLALAALVARRRRRITRG